MCIKFTSSTSAWHARSAEKHDTIRRCLHLANIFEIMNVYRAPRWKACFCFSPFHSPHTSSQSHDIPWYLFHFHPFAGFAWNQWTDRQTDVSRIIVCRKASFSLLFPFPWRPNQTSRQPHARPTFRRAFSIYHPLASDIDGQTDVSRIMLRAIGQWGMVSRRNLSHWSGSPTSPGWRLPDTHHASTTRRIHCQCSLELAETSLRLHQNSGKLKRLVI